MWFLLEEKNIKLVIYITVAKCFKIKILWWIKNGMNNLISEYILFNIIKIFYNFKIYGYKMITLWINKIYNLKLKFHVVYRYMRNMSLKAKVHKKFDYRTKSGSLRYDNLLKRDFQPLI